MEENLKKTFEKLVYEPKVSLAENIWINIVKREKRFICVRLCVFSIVGFLSILGFIPALKSLFSEFTQSGFYEYLSIAFSSGNNLFSYWKELLSSLAESLPVVNIIFIFSLVFVFLLSIRYVLKQIINNNYIGKTYVQV
jgi:hypothetical protein